MDDKMKAKFGKMSKDPATAAAVMKGKKPGMSGMMAECAGCMAKMKASGMMKDGTKMSMMDDEGAE